MRTILIAAAMLTCCKWVLFSPTERERRMSKARTPCEIVASIPAHRAYCFANVGVRSRRRTACNASCCSRGRTVINRRGPEACEEVQQAGRGQLPQSLVENLIEIAPIFLWVQSG